MDDRLRRFIITEPEADLTSHAGLGLIGMALNERTDLGADAQAVSPLRSDAMPHATILSGYIALLCLGKSDFEAINGFREDTYFAQALALKQVPPEGIMRQRMDANAVAYNILRWIGQHGLLGPDAPPRHRAKRRRMRTVMQELMYLAARLIHSGRRLKLAFGCGCTVVPIVRRLYAQLACT